MCRSLMYCVRYGWSTRGIHHACAPYKHLLAESESERLLWPLSFLSWGAFISLNFEFQIRRPPVCRGHWKRIFHNAALEPQPFPRIVTQHEQQHNIEHAGLVQGVRSFPNLGKRGVAVGEEHFHVEQNLVLIEVSAYDLSGEQSEAWLSGEEVAKRCNSEHCYQCRWAATLEWELYLHCPTPHEATPPIVAFPENLHALEDRTTRTSDDVGNNDRPCNTMCLNSQECGVVLRFARRQELLGSRVVGKKLHEMVLIGGRFWNNGIITLSTNCIMVSQLNELSLLFTITHPSVCK
jgi:hypothetical protein